jgi:hypothetical protein
MASGEANGLTVKDFAITTVVVATTSPKLPNTGIPFGEKNISWDIIIIFGVFILVLTAILVFLRKRLVFMLRRINK